MRQSKEDLAFAVSRLRGMLAHGVLTFAGDEGPAPAIYVVEQRRTQSYHFVNVYIIDRENYGPVWLTNYVRAVGIGAGGFSRADVLAVKSDGGSPIHQIVANAIHNITGVQVHAFRM